MEDSSIDSTVSDGERVVALVDSDYILHEVSATDTLAGLAIKYNTTMKEIRRKNRLVSDGVIFGKRYLKIPRYSCHHEVHQNTIDALPHEALLILSNINTLQNQSRKGSFEESCKTHSSLSSADYENWSYVEQLPSAIELTSLNRSSSSS